MQNAGDSRSHCGVTARDLRFVAVASRFSHCSSRGYDRLRALLRYFRADLWIGRRGSECASGQERQDVLNFHSGKGGPEAGVTRCCSKMAFC